MIIEYTYAYKSIDFGLRLKLCYMVSQPVSHSDKTEITNYEYLVIGRRVFRWPDLPIIFFCKKVLTRPELTFKSEIGTFIINLN